MSHKRVAREKLALNILSVKTQMEEHGEENKGLGLCPRFKKLIYNSDVINLWFEANIPIQDFLRAESAACNAVGWTMLQQALVEMEKWWKN